MQNKTKQNKPQKKPTKKKEKKRNEQINKETNQTHINCFDFAVKSLQCVLRNN